MCVCLGEGGGRKCYFLHVQHVQRLRFLLTVVGLYCRPVLFEYILHVLGKS